MKGPAACHSCIWLAKASSQAPPCRREQLRTGIILLTNLAAYGVGTFTETAKHYERDIGDRLSETK
jgi:hypothetical protein